MFHTCSCCIQPALFLFHYDLQRSSYSCFSSPSPPLLLPLFFSHPSSYPPSPFLLPLLHLPLPILFSLPLPSPPIFILPLLHLPLLILFSLALLHSFILPFLYLPFPSSSPFLPPSFLLPLLPILFFFPCSPFPPNPLFLSSQFIF